jgi:hypothetical protein
MAGMIFGFAFVARVTDFKDRAAFIALIASLCPSPRHAETSNAIADWFTLLITIHSDCWRVFRW